MILILAPAAWILLLPVISHLYRGFHILALVRHAVEQEQTVCQIQISSQDFHAESTIFWNTLLDDRYYVLDVGADTLTIHDGTVFFQNGNGYDCSGLTAAFDAASLTDWRLLLFLKTERSVLDGQILWKIHLNDRMVSLFSQDQVSVPHLELSLYEVSGSLSALSVSHERFQLTIQRTEASPDPIPTDRLMGMTRQNLPDIRSLRPLVQTCLQWINSGAFQADAVIYAECGPLSLEESGTLQWKEGSLQFNRKGQWISVTPKSVNAYEMIAGAGWFFLKEGVWEAHGDSNGLFSVKIPAEYWNTSIRTLLPDLEELTFTRYDGSLFLEFKENQLESAHLSCTGEIPFLITTLPLSIEVEITIPQ